MPDGTPLDPAQSRFVLVCPQVSLSDQPSAAPQSTTARRIPEGEDRKSESGWLAYEDLKPGDEIYHEMYGKITVVDIDLDSKKLTYDTPRRGGIVTAMIKDFDSVKIARLESPEYGALLVIRARKIINKERAFLLFGCSQLANRVTRGKYYRNIVLEELGSRAGILSAWHKWSDEDVQKRKRALLRIYQGTGEDLVLSGLHYLLAAKGNMPGWRIFANATRRNYFGRFVIKTAHNPEIDYYYRRMIARQGIRGLFPKNALPVDALRPNYVHVGDFDLEDVGDEFSSDLKSLIENPTIERARALAASYKENIVRKLNGYEIDIVAPIPSSEAAAVLAQAIAELISKPLDLKFLSKKKKIEVKLVSSDDNVLRHRYITPQAEQKGHYDRALNVSGAYNASKVRAQDKTVLVVDDVIASGSTVNETLRVAYSKGYAKKVIPLVFGKASFGE
jgi:predicted amidophosphoribosyltransferase